MPRECLSYNTVLFNFILMTPMFKINILAFSNISSVLAEVDIFTKVVVSELHRIHANLEKSFR